MDVRGSTRAGAQPVDRFDPQSERFARDSALEEAVTSEPVSAAKFRWEDTGNFIDSGLDCASTAVKSVSKPVSYEPIPYSS